MKNIAHVIIFVLGATLSGCATPSLSWPSFPATPKAPEKRHEQTGQHKYEKEPVPVKVQFIDKDGKLAEGSVIVGFKEKEETSYSINASEAKGKQSVFSKIKAIGWVWVVLMLLGLFFPPIAIFMAYINSRLKAGIKKIVGGVEKGVHKLENGSAEKFLNELSVHYDDSTKKLVKDVKDKGV